MPGARHLALQPLSGSSGREDGSKRWFLPNTDEPGVLVYLEGTQYLGGLVSVPRGCDHPGCHPQKAGDSSCGGRPYPWAQQGRTARNDQLDSGGGCWYLGSLLSRVISSTRYKGQTGSRSQGWTRVNVAPSPSSSCRHTCSFSEWLAEAEGWVLGFAAHYSSHHTTPEEQRPPRDSVS